MASSSSPFVRVQLTPKAGFCVKTTTSTPAVLPPPPNSDAKSTNSPNERLEPPAGPLAVPQGRKVFINIAWDPNVPAPPEASDEVIRRAMEGGEESQDGWFVPVVVSNAREDVDKAGKPSLLFDCIFNNGVKARTLRDPDFKLYLVELALQNIEVQTGLVLSRVIATPNIASKGKLQPRAINLPSSLVNRHKNITEPAGTVANIPSTPDKQVSKPLIQEIDSTPRASPVSKASDTSLPGLRGILKKPAASKPGPPKAVETVDPLAPLEWDWSKDEKGRLRIVVQVPSLTPALISASELDISPRRIELYIPQRPRLDIDLAPSDAEIVSRVGGAYADAAEALNIQAAKARTPKEKISLQDDGDLLDERRQGAHSRALRLKRERDFDVDGADAEWKIGDGQVVIYV